MREHEVPTHVQAEDKVLLGFTFPQIVAVVAMCAVSYGVYRYFPLGPWGLKLGVAIAFGIAGISLTVGKVGGRGLPLVAADLLKFKLGARHYAGAPVQLARSEAPPRAGGETRPAAAAGKKGRLRREQGGPGSKAQGASSLPAPRLVRQAPAQGSGARQRRQRRQTQR